MGINNDDNELLDTGRKEDERIRNDLMRVVLGDRDLSGNGRMNRGRAVFVKDEILEKKKKKDESEQREAIKRAQEALDRHLEELQRQIEAIKKQITEAKKDILDVEEQLRKKYGDNWEEKFRRGEADKNDRLYKEWAQKHERLDELEKKREEMETRVETLKQEWSKAKTPKEKQAVVADAKADVIWANRVMERVTPYSSVGVKEHELVSYAQDKLVQGQEITVEILQTQHNAIKNDADTFFSAPTRASTSIAANIDGDGSYKKSIGREGLSSQKAFTSASNGTSSDSSPRRAEDQEPKVNVNPPSTGATV
jgi:chromosome segregation ATPase